jgi:hypothetical protein
VSITPPPPATTLDGLLDDLPEGWAVGHRQAARLVVGPSGAFVLVPGDGDLSIAAEQAHGLAQRTRSAMARHLSWVPFVDAAVVTSGDEHAEVAAILVPLDLLAELLVQGPPVIDRPAIALMSNLLAAGSLDGWQVGTVSIDVKIDLCDPPLQPSTTAPH